MEFCLTENNISQLQILYVQKLSWKTHRKHRRHSRHYTADTHTYMHLCVQCMHRCSMAHYAV